MASAPILDLRFDSPGCFASGVAFGRKGEAVSITRATSATYVSGSTEGACTSGQIRVNDLGVSADASVIQYLVSPDAPANQSVTLTPGTYTGWLVGTGSMALTAGTAVSAQLPCTATAGTGECGITIGTGGTVNVAFTGSVTFAQVTRSRSRSNPIHSATTVDPDRLSLLNPITSSSPCKHVVVNPAPYTTLPWTFNGSTMAAWSTGAQATANTEAFYFNASGVPTYRVIDKDSGERTWTFTSPAATDPAASAGHVFTVCNRDGALSGYMDGSENGSVSGAGTGIVTTQPAALQIGSHGPSAGYLGTARVERFMVTRGLSGMPRPPWEGRRVSALGDSITSGDQCAVGQYNRYPDHLGRSIGARYLVDNDGVSGQTAASIAARLPNVLARPANAVVIEAGVNDLKNCAAGCSATLWPTIRAMYDSALAAGLDVYAVTVLPWKNWAAYWTSTKQTETEALNDLIRAYNPSPRFHVVDAYAAMGGADPATLAAAYDCGDGVHPGKAGNRKLAELVRAAFP